MNYFWLFSSPGKKKIEKPEKESKGKPNILRHVCQIANKTKTRNT
jgi:hypothetical protein